MHILICDDDAVFGRKLAGYVQDYFEAHGIQVETTVCTSGKEALQVPDHPDAPLRLSPPLSISRWLIQTWHAGLRA